MLFASLMFVPLSCIFVQHVAPFLSSESTTHHPHQSFLSNPLSKLIEYLSSEIRCAILHTYRLELVPLHPSAKAILDQKYVGDITIVPDVTLSDYPQLLVNPTAERLKACIQASEYSTWKLIPVIRGACEIEFTLDECVRRMRGMIIMEEVIQHHTQRMHACIRTIRAPFPMLTVSLLSLFVCCCCVSPASSTCMWFFCSSFSPVSRAQLEHRSSGCCTHEMHR